MMTTLNTGTIVSRMIIRTIHAAKAENSDSDDDNGDDNNNDNDDRHVGDDCHLHFYLNDLSDCRFPTVAFRPKACRPISLQKVDMVLWFSKAN